MNSAKRPSQRLVDKRARAAPRARNAKEMMDLALFYCSRRETSRPKLKQYLYRKCGINRNSAENESTLEMIPYIEATLNELERLKVIDHERYAGILSREYARRGKGKRYVENKLKEKGLAEESKKIEFTAEDELTRATELAIRTLLRTQVQKIEEPFKKKQKVLQKLVSSGFDFSIAKKAIEQAYLTADDEISEKE